MPGRKFVTSAAYRYGFNGKENDNETVSTGEGTQDFGARIYNPALGRWLSTDPLQAKYPSLSPYNFTANNPIYFIDPDGRKIIVHYDDDNGKRHRVVIRKVTDIEKLKDAQGFGGDMYKTLNYLKDDANMQEAISLRRTVHVRETMGGDMVGFVAREATNPTVGERWQHQIYYNAQDPLLLKDDAGNLTGQYQSPALGFLHEIGHFLNRIKNGAKKHRENAGVDKNGEFHPDGTPYHSPEEKDVIQRIETPFAEKHGEPVRTNHRGDIDANKAVDDPTQHSNSNPASSSEPEKK